MRCVLSVNLRGKVNLRGGVEHEGCRRSSALHSVGLHVPRITVRAREMVTKNVRGLLFFSFSASCAFAHVRFSMFGDQIKPPEPQDKSDRRKKRERGEPWVGMRAEHKCWVEEERENRGGRGRGGGLRRGTDESEDARRGGGSRGWHGRFCRDVLVM